MPAQTKQGGSAVDTSVLEPWIKDVPSGVSAIVALLALGSVVFWIFHRTVSLHVFRLRVWQLFQGRHPVTDPTVKAYIDGRTSTQAFAFFSGVLLPPTCSPAQLIAWCEERKLRPHALGYCGEYFDVDTMSLTGKRPWLWFHYLMGVIFWLTFCGSAWLLLFQPQTTLLSFKDNGTYFWADKTSVRSIDQPLPWLNDYVSLNTPRCTAAAPQWDELASRTGFSARDTERLCSTLAETKDWQAFIAKTVEHPVGTTLKFMALVLLPLLVHFFSIKTYHAIRRVQQRLEEHAGVMGPPSPFGRLRRWWRRRAMGA